MPSIPLSPSNISFTHKQGEALPLGVLINHGYGEVIFPKTTPSWLDLYDITTTDFKVKLSSNVNALTAGNYAETITISSASNVDASGNFLISSNLYVNLQLINTLLLNVSPVSGAFNFVVGGSQPANKSFTVTSEIPWTTSKNANWLTILNGSGNSSGAFSVSVTTTGLAPGVYNDTITISDGTATKTVAISLTVSNANTGTDFINIFPTLLNFGFTKTGVIPNTQNIDVNASANYTITTAQSWLDLGATTGVAGVNVVTIGLKSLAALPVGNHIGYVDFILGGIVKRVTVKLTIYQLISETLNSGQLYFADDDNNIKVSSGRNDTKLVMNIATAFEGKNYNLTYNPPFSNGVAKKRLGQEAKNVIGNRKLFSIVDAYVLTPYLPLSMNIDFNEVDKISGAIVQTVSIANIKFLKGKKPAANMLSNLPSTVFLTNKGMLIFSVISNGQPSGNIILDGGVNKTITGGVSGFPYYTVVLPISTLGDLYIGTEFTVSLLGQSINVVIIAENLEHSILYAENQWGVFEAFEFTGEVEENRAYKDEVFTFRNDHLTTKTEVYEKSVATTYKINTGYVYTDQMIDYLDKIMSATNYFLQTPTGLVQVRNTTKKLQMRKSLAEYKSSSLTFENLIK